MLDFLGIGAQKCGTTWLYEMLCLHPAVRFPAGKEIHFWNRKLDTDMEWYRSTFSDTTPGFIQGEITPAYAMLPVEVIEQIRAFNPDLRAIYSIRNPIERAWSAALQALERAEMTIEEASDRWFLDHFQSAGSTMRGDYESCLRNWRQVFPPDQILVLRYNMIGSEPRRYLAMCSTHLNIESGFYDTVPSEVLAERHYPGSGHPIRPRLLQALREQYRDRIQRLSVYLETDLSDWLR